MLNSDVGCEHKIKLNENITMPTLNISATNKILINTYHEIEAYAHTTNSKPSTTVAFPSFQSHFKVGRVHRFAIIAVSVKPPDEVSKEVTKK